MDSVAVKSARTGTVALFFIQRNALVNESRHPALSKASNQSGTWGWKVFVQVHEEEERE